MNFSKISVKQFIKESKAGNIDLAKFYEEFNRKAKELDSKYNFFITRTDAKKGKKEGRLSGLPVSVKDNICTKGIQTTAGSKILEGYVPPFDATAVRKIKDNGGVVAGKTAQDEFGFGTFSVNCAYRIPKNPHDAERSCGGSSGGAGGFTAAIDMPHIALGQSTGGSISAPSAFCGVVGITPTYGLVSRYGLIDYASSLDKIGLIGKTVEDVALMLSIISGHDERDQTSVDKQTEDYTKNIGKSVRGVKIGVPEEFFGGEVDESIKNIIWSKIKELEEKGASYEKVSLPNTKYSIASYYIIAMAEASTNLAKFCGMRYGMHLELKGTFGEYFSKVRAAGFGEETKRRILLGTYARMAGYRDQYYLKALKVRRLIIDDYKKAFRNFDVLISPGMPFVAPKFSEIEKLSPVEHYYADILTGSPNLAGIPHLSMPAGKLKGMPVGMHILGDHLQEGKIIQTGSAIES